MNHFLSNTKNLRLTLSLLSFIICVPFLSAKVRTAEEAQQTARKYLSARANAAKAELSQPSSTRSETNNYFVFDIKGDNGYVIVSADDRFEDILGYADNGNFSSALENPNFSFWLSSLSSEMAQAPAPKIMTKSTRVADAPTVAPLLKTKWGQGSPYNNYCPEVWYGGEYSPAPTGCVATAMAQVLRYHQWPPSYKIDDETSYDYKWDLMAYEYGYEGTESEESLDQVASLMMHCGQSVWMYYAAGGSSASSIEVPRALVRNFGFDPSTIRYIERDMYGYEKMHNMLYTELEEGRPVIASGTYPGSSAGHEFVLDGCNSDGLFHFNWGWNGYCDGYYRLTSLRPEDYGTGGDSAGYSFDVYFIIGAKPLLSEVEDTQLPDMYALGDLKLLYTNENEDFIETDYNPLLEFQISTENGDYDGFINLGLGNFKGRFHTLLTNLATGEETLNHRSHGGNISFNYMFNSMSLYADQLKDNTCYKATLVYKLNDDDDPRPVIFPPGRRSYLLIERKGDIVRASMPKAESAITCELPAELSRIERRGTNALHFKVKISNPGEEEYSGKVKWQYFDEEGSLIYGLTDYAMADILPGEESDVDFYLENLYKASPGTYSVGLYDFRDRLIGERRQVEICDYNVEINETNFPDQAFRDFISVNYDSDSNGLLSDSELSNARYVNIKEIPVTDLSGIEYFYNIYGLSLRGLSLTSLDLSAGPALSWLEIYDTPLENINLENQKSLYSLSIGKTELSNLNLSELPSLESLYLQESKFTALDLSTVPDLVNLSCYGNQIEKLDISFLQSLQSVNASQNSIKELKLPAQAPLTYISLYDNSLEGSLDLSAYPNLTSIDLSQNNLSEVIFCDMPDLTQLSLSNNSISGTLDLSSSDKLSMIWIDNNKISGLNLGDMAQLLYLSIFNNSLTGVLDLSEMANLEDCAVNGNQLQELIFGNHPNLENLYLYSNLLEGVLDISGMPALKRLNAYSNNLSELKYAEHPALEVIDLDFNAFTHFRGEDFPALINCSLFNQKVAASITTADFDLSSLLEAGFDINRASNWNAAWPDGGYWTGKPCEVVDGKVIIPEEAGEEVRLSYSYITNLTDASSHDFTINLTREGFGGVDDIIAAEQLSVHGNSVIFADGVYGEVFNPGGENIFSGYGETPALAAGIYIVRIGSSVVKIAIP